MPIKEKYKSLSREELLDKVYELGVDFERYSGSCSQCTAAAIQEILDFEPVQDDFIPGALLHSKNRVLGEGEKLFLTTESQGYLIRLQSTGWLSETQLNLIIENAGMEYPIPVSIREIMEITSRYVPEIPDDVLAGAEPRSDSLN